MDEQRGARAKRDLRELAEVLELGQLSIERVRLVGNGTEASADLYLTNGTEIHFPKLRMFGTVGQVKVAIAAATGVNPEGLKGAACIEALALMRRVAEVQETATDDDIARDWGVSYLQTAQVAALDMNNQAERWAWFEKLNETDPLETARAQGGKSVARETIVLEDTRTGDRYIRVNWFGMYVRQQASYVSPQELAARMERVGWKRRGSRGQVKATAPQFERTLSHRFYVVERGWKDE